MVVRTPQINRSLWQVELYLDHIARDPEASLVRPLTDILEYIKKLESELDELQKPKVA